MDDKSPQKKRFFLAGSSNNCNCWTIFVPTISCQFGFYSIFAHHWWTAVVSCCWPRCWTQFVDAAWGFDEKLTKINQGIITDFDSGQRLLAKFASKIFQMVPSIVGRGTKQKYRNPSTCIAFFWTSHQGIRYFWHFFNFLMFLISRNQVRSEQITANRLFYMVSSLISKLMAICYFLKSLCGKLLSVKKNPKISEVESSLLPVIGSNFLVKTRWPFKILWFLHVLALSID